MQRYIRAYQKDVTRLLAMLVQACHSMLPPEELLPTIRCIADNLVSDRCAPEVIALGINTLREVFDRVPLILEEEQMKPLVEELVNMRHFKNKSVIMAARSVLNLARNQYPAVLPRRQRGKDSGESQIVE